MDRREHEQKALEIISGRRNQKRGSLHGEKMTGIAMFSIFLWSAALVVTLVAVYAYFHKAS